MRTHIVFAERASVHDDGTFNLIRGGLSMFGSVDGIAAVSGDLLITIEHEPGNAGVHELKLRTIDQDGESIIGGVEGAFDTPPINGVLHLAIRLHGELPDGSYEVHASIDDEFVASCPIEVADRWSSSEAV